MKTILKIFKELLLTFEISLCFVIRFLAIIVFVVAILSLYSFYEEGTFGIYMFLLLEAIAFLFGWLVLAFLKRICKRADKIMNPKKEENKFIAKKPFDFS